MSDLLNPSELPNSFVDEDALDEFMTRPSRALIDDLEAIDGDIMVLFSSRLGNALWLALAVSIALPYALDYKRRKAETSGGS